MEGKALEERRESCPACGYCNEVEESRCEKCGRSLHLLRRSPASVPPNPADPRPAAGPAATGGLRDRIRKTAGNPVTRRALPDSVRRQLSVSVQEFRSRQLNQTLPLQFDPQPPGEPKLVLIRPLPNAATQRWGRTGDGSRARSRPAVPGLQAGLDFPTPPPPTADFSIPPVAPLGLRMLACLADFGVTLAALPIFLAPLRLLAGPVAPDRSLLAGSLCAYLVLTLLYGWVFLYLAGATPAMRWTGLRLVNFDGAPASREQRLWRLLGSLVSAGSFLLGYFWAIADEEKLSWQDRMSKTFLTAARHS